MTKHSPLPWHHGTGTPDAPRDIFDDHQHLITTAYTSGGPAQILANAEGNH